MSVSEPQENKSSTTNGSVVDSITSVPLRGGIRSKPKDGQILTGKQEHCGWDLVQLRKLSADPL
jgi:hypothetical protein